jgi:hypothetical protein
MGRTFLGNKMFLQNTIFSSCATLMQLISSFGTDATRLFSAQLKEQKLLAEMKQTFDLNKGRKINRIINVKKG